MNIAAYIRINAAVFWMLPLAAAAAALPLDESLWVEVNPLGGVFTNGTYECRGKNVQVFARAAGFGISSNVTFSADFTPGETGGTMWKTAAIALEETPHRYWHVALVESPPPVNWRAFELSEMRDGVWQADKSLVCETNYCIGAWKNGECYRLAIKMGDGVVEGDVRSSSGETVFRKRYRLSPGAVGCGVPVISGGRLNGRYANVEIEAGAAVQSTAVPSPQKATPCWRIGYDAAGRAQFISSDGDSVFLAGCGVVNYTGDFDLGARRHVYGDAMKAIYGSHEVWASAAVEKLKGLGFNTIAFSDGILLRRGLMHTEMLNFGATVAACDDELNIVAGNEQPCTAMPNVFSPKFAEYCRFVAGRLCYANRNDPWLIGYYLDNELAWWGGGPDFHSGVADGIFNAVAKKGEDHSAKIALREFLRLKGITDPAAASSETKREFVRLVARRYFETATSAIREVDPNHLILGCRFAGLTTADRVVWEECGRFCDVVSVNCYPIADLSRGVILDGEMRWAPLFSDVIKERSRWAGRPIIVTEWSFSSLESPCPCEHGAGQRFATQKERAEAASIFLKTLYSLPCVAGHVFFRWCDQPPGGASGSESENCNYGLFAMDGSEYEDMTRAMALVQKASAYWRRQPPPEPRTVATPSPGECASALVDGNATSPVFAKDASGAFSADNGLIRLHGCVGKDGLRICEKGQIYAMICTGGPQPRWPSARRVVEASGSVKDGGCILDVTFASQAGRYHMKERYFLPAGKRTFVAEHMVLTNNGDEPISPPRVFFSLVPDGTPDDVRSTLISRPKMFWNPRPSASWLFRDGSSISAVAPECLNVDVRFFSENGVFHGDIPYEMPRTATSVTYIAPEEEYGFPEHPYVTISLEQRGVSRE